MQFISQDPVHQVISNGTPPLYDTSQRLVNPGSRRVWAKFKRGIPIYALPLAQQIFDFTRVPPGYVDDPSRWFSFYDSAEAQVENDWTDEERKLIEERLTKMGYDQVEPDKPALPYPAYEKNRKIIGKRTLAHAVKDIKAAMDATGIPLAVIEAYEHSCSDENTDALLEALASDDVVEEEVVKA